MKNFSILESAVIGFFVGIIVATYISFVVSTGRYLGYVLNWISLKSVFNLFPIEYKESIFYNFIFIVIVFVIYGIIVGLLCKKSKKIVILILVIILAIVIWEQQKSVAKESEFSDLTYQYQTNIEQTVSTKGKQYFGNEAIGDLNNDGKDDVAFFINRNDDDGRGDIFYLTSAIKTEEGRMGTNLIYLGENIEPKKIIIEEGLIFVDYEEWQIDENTGEEATTTKVFSAQLIDGKLKETVATSTENIES